ncbi:metallophosphoesterase [Candidatus Colwellia aromaticivorans]|uniref:metallophosphoesterase n=1 Tax=Candidatus Colwellia aromaticivorans TaxID=2267621 RepID=UPI000DF149E3|nr:metallophosphoesterase [Candidatus Colwellia aromaticivorans]
MTTQNKPFIIAQFSDCHLFADKKVKHFGANVWQNLTQVLTDIALRDNIDCAVFTGDLTQDHSELSYQYFAEAVAQAKFTIPVYFLAGNHDDKEMIAKYLVVPNFQTNNIISHDFWQVQLLDSKSETPSGLVSETALDELAQRIDKNKFQLLMMHHHPVDIGYYIDKHGLKNQQVFWQAVNQLNNEDMKIKAIACGHVHRASQLTKDQVDIYTCPATSVQFGDTKEKMASILPSYRLLYLDSNGTIASEIVRP